MPIARAVNRFGGYLFENFLKRQFFRNIAVVLTGAALAQLISVALSPVISRLFSPEAFGVLGTFMAVLGLIGPVATLAYAAAIVIPKGDDESAGIVWLSLAISAMASILSLFIVIAVNLCSRDTWLGSVQALLYLLPLVILFEGLFQVAQQWMIRERRYRQTAQVNILQSVISSLAKIGAGLVVPSAFALVLVSLLAVPINATLFVVTLNYRRRGPFWPQLVSLNTIKAAAHRYRDFPLYRMPQSLVGGVAQSLPLLVLAYFHGASAAGFFALSNSVLGAPTQLLTKAINDVFFPRLVDASHRREPTKALILKAAAALTGVSIVPLGAIAVAGPFLFQLVFGARWFEAGEFSQWLSLLTFSTLILRSALSAAPILNIQGMYLTFEVVSTASKLAALSMTFFFDLQATTVVALFSVVGSVLNGLFFWYTIIQAERFDKSHAHITAPR